jgi:hypothetical protein
VENERLEQGFTGHVKPITRSIFSNWHKLEQFADDFESPLRLDYPYARNWDTQTWAVYFGMAKEYLRGLVSGRHGSSNARGLFHVFKTTELAYEQIGNLENYANTFDPHNPYWHASEANDFLKEIVKIFDEAGERVYFNRKDKYLFGNDLSARIARLLHDAIFHASGVNTKGFRMWEVQHNLIWRPMALDKYRQTTIMKMARRKLRRMIWEDICEMDQFPNYKGARYVRFCLNVLDFYDEELHRRRAFKTDSWPLAKVVSGWVSRNYQTIAKTHPPVAEAMLPANITFDPVKNILVRTKDDSLTGIPRIKEFPLKPLRTSIS